MMFTLQQMQAAHSKVKTGADFPKYVQEIKNAGLLYYTFCVSNGATIYTGKDGHELNGNAKYGTLNIYPSSNGEVLYYNISVHQQGHSDFITFCRQAAACGVDNWVIDTQPMLCTYYDTAGNKMIAEPIPGYK